MVNAENWIDGFELTPVGTDVKEYKWIKDKMSRTIAEHNGEKINGYEILEVKIILILIQLR
jgi:hypothetical protein